MHECQIQLRMLALLITSIYRVRHSSSHTLVTAPIETPLVVRLLASFSASFGDNPIFRKQFCTQQVRWRMSACQLSQHRQYAIM